MSVRTFVRLSASPFVRTFICPLIRQSVCIFLLYEGAQGRNLGKYL